jgi:hypothetical protein
MPSGHWKRLATSWALLAVMLLVAGGLIAIISSTVLPEAGFFVWAAVGLMLFLLVQLVVFRLLGLRSRADEAADTIDAAGREAPGLGDITIAARIARRGSELEREESERAAEPEREGERNRDEEPSSERSRDWRAWRG